MGRLLLSALLLAIAPGCASTLDVGQMPQAPKDYLVGTWSDGHTIETFLSDGTYCSSPANTGSARSVGTWEASSAGSLTVDVERAIDAHEITPADVEEIRVVLIPKAGQLLMGYSCSHCEGGIAGSIFRRSLPGRVSCAISEGG